MWWYEILLNDMWWYENTNKIMICDDMKILTSTWLMI